MIRGGWVGGGVNWVGEEGGGGRWRRDGGEGREWGDLV